MDVNLLLQLLLKLDKIEILWRIEMQIWVWLRHIVKCVIYVCVCVCIYLYIYLYIYIYIHTHTHTHTHTYIYEEAKESIAAMLSQISDQVLKQSVSNSCIRDVWSWDFCQRRTDSKAVKQIEMKGFWSRRKWKPSAAMEWMQLQSQHGFSLVLAVGDTV